MYWTMLYNTYVYWIQLKWPEKKWTRGKEKGKIVGLNLLQPLHLYCGQCNTLSFRNQGSEPAKLDLVRKSKNCIDLIFSSGSPKAHNNRNWEKDWNFDNNKNLISVFFDRACQCLVEVWNKSSGKIRMNRLKPCQKVSTTPLRQWGFGNDYLSAGQH